MKAITVNVDLDDEQISTIAAAWLDDRPAITHATIALHGKELEALEDRLSEQAADRVLVALRKRFTALRDDD